MAKVKGLFSTTGVETSSSSSVSSSWHKLSNCPASVVEKLVGNFSAAEEEELPFLIGDEVVGRFAPKCVVLVVPAGRPYLSSGKALMEALNSDETSKLSLFALGLKDPVLGSI